VLNTFDVDAQHQRFLGRHTLVAGTGFRIYVGDDHGLGPGFIFDPRESTTRRFNLFAQDDIAFQPARLYLTLGTKLEHNDFTGFELQPTVRARWNPTPAQTAWGSISRAVRVPSRFDTDLRILAPNASTVVLKGSDQFESETLIAYEAGYRSRVGDRMSIDVAVFNNRYDDLRSQEFPAAPGQPVVLDNMLNATTKGIELTGTAQLAPWWQAHASYGRMWERFTLDPASRDLTHGTSEYNDPEHVFKLRSSINVADDVEIEGLFRYSSALPHPAVKAYSELEARLGWRARPGWDVSLIGHNLLAPRHIEFAAGTPLETFERALIARSTWRF
jgi:iron complex outermembrane receptor protein